MFDCKLSVTIDISDKYEGGEFYIFQGGERLVSELKPGNLIIAKDRLGSKPLYIYEDTEYLSFCSEIKGFQALIPPEYDDQYLGFIDIADDYSSTKAGKLANYYAGLSYLYLGEFENAIDYLEDFYK